MSESAAMRKRLEELRAKKAERVEKRQAKDEAGELVELELEEKYSGEGKIAGGAEERLGERGITFEIIDTPDGHLVVRLGDWLHYKKFMSCKRVNDVPTPEDVLTFVLANLAYPDRDRALAITNKFAAVATRCANALVDMHQGRRKTEEGKY